MDIAVLVLVLMPVLSKCLLLLLLPGFNLSALPLHVCDIAGILCALALVSRSATLATAGSLTVLLLSSIAIFQPDLGIGPTPAELALFWVRHISLLVATAYLVFGLGLLPTWKGYALWFVLSLAYATGISLLNPVLGTQFGYLTEIRNPPALLALGGPWPQRLVFLFSAPMLLGAGLTALAIRTSSRRRAIHRND